MIQIYDTQLEFVSAVGLKDAPKKLLYVKELDSIVIGEGTGNIELMSVKTWQITQSF
jgi:hypothetical protein